MAKVNTDESPEIAEKLGVSAIPAVFAYHQGQVVDKYPPLHLRVHHYII